MKKPVNPLEIEIQVQIFVRPSDIGNMPMDPYEIVETDKGDFNYFTFIFPRDSQWTCY